MEVKETVVPISARLIANRASYKFKHEEIVRLCRRVEERCRKAGYLREEEIR